MTGPQLDLMEGRRRLRKVLESHEEAKSWLIEEVDRRLVARVRDGATCTVDAAHEILEDILQEDVELGFPERDLDRRFLGNVFAYRDHWQNTRRVRPTRRPSRNAAPVTIWRLDESKLNGEG